MGKEYGEESVDERLLRLEQEVSRLTIERKQLNINNNKKKKPNNKRKIEIGNQVIPKQAPYHTAP